LGGRVELGKAKGFVRIWAYQGMDDRRQRREEGRERGVWPPPGGGSHLLTQDNKILLPASFSPLQ